MLIGNAKGYSKIVMSRFKELGYRRSCFAERGRLRRLQRRERVFFVAVRNDIDVPPLKLACSISGSVQAMRQAIFRR